MLIKCQECGHENQLGSIFCRSCGKKLDLEAVNPEMRDTKKFGIFKALKRVFLLCLLVVLTGVIGGLFWAPELVDYTPLDEAQKLEAEKKHGMIELKLMGGGGKTNTFSFSPAEATYLLNNVILQKTETSEANPPIIIKTDALKKTRVVLKGKIYDYVPVRLELVGITGNPEASAPDYNDSDKLSLTMRVDEIRMGRLGLPKALHEVSLANFKPILESEKVKKTLGAVRELSIGDEGNFNITLKTIKVQEKK